MKALVYVLTEHDGYEDLATIAVYTDFDAAHAEAQRLTREKNEEFGSLIQYRVDPVEFRG